MKHLVVANEAIAKAKLHQAVEEECPNRRALQLALHNANPVMYDHPDTFDWDNDLAGGYFVADDGRCEIFINDDKAQFFNVSDQAQMTDGLTIAMENIKERKPK